MVYVDIDPQHVQEFNEWYNKEHLPELLSVPGILSAARYEAVKGGPQYLACYELESVTVMRTPAFTSRPRTPWGQKVSPSVIGKNLTRIVGEQIYPDGAEMPERGMAPVLQIGRMSVPAEVDAEWNASGTIEPALLSTPSPFRSGLFLITDFSRIKREETSPSLGPRFSHLVSCLPRTSRRIFA